MRLAIEQTDVLGVRVDIVSRDDLFTYALNTIREDGKAVIAYVNVHAVNLAYENPVYRQIINSSQVIFCDGFGVKWAVRLIKGKYLHRLTPPDWFGSFAGECAERGFSMFFLGTRQDVIEKAASLFRRKYPELKIVGVHHGFFDKSKQSSENREVLQMIDTLHPDVLVVGFGMPIQEEWIFENLSALNTHVIFPVGAFFDYFTGEVNRAPQWMTDNGWEWLGRLVIDPFRLWKRYLIGNPLFLWRIIKHNVFGFPLPYPLPVENRTPE